jgi:hypothetical protein
MRSRCTLSLAAQWSREGDQARLDLAARCHRLRQHLTSSSASGTLLAYRCALPRACSDVACPAERLAAAISAWVPQPIGPALVPLSVSSFSLAGGAARRELEPSPVQDPRAVATARDGFELLRGLVERRVPGYTACVPARVPASRGISMVL